MDKPWTGRRLLYMTNVLFLILCCASLIQSCASRNETKYIDEESAIDKELKDYVDQVLNVDRLNLMPGVEIEKSADNFLVPDSSKGEDCATERSMQSVEDYTEKKIEQFTQTHVLAVDVPETARFLYSSAAGEPPTGKSSFMAGVGVGFLAFLVQKLLLPVFIGAQLIKSVMIALFLPSIMGGLSKLVGKGLSTAAGISGASAGVQGQKYAATADVEDFQFKDTGGGFEGEEEGMEEEFMEAEDADGMKVEEDSNSNNNKLSINQRVGTYPSHHLHNTDNYYHLRKPNRKTDYKVFHKIPSSSLLLTSYDPFYSPLLSRIDSVFHQLGLGDEKSPETERCRERLVCMMYANPAKYAPYSNLVSAQLSRELNELRKPASDNPEILRFFRYMKAAKDGQDGEECLAHGGCPSLSSSNPSPAMLTTFNDINKLVQARNLN